MALKLVNGPIICTRLEGTVNGVKKIIYLFGDNHSQIHLQTQCPTYKATDFTKYFVETMGKTDKNINYDLFFEIGQTLHGKNPAYKDRYIDEFVKYFKETINISNNKDPDNKKNKSVSSSINKGSRDEPNLRLHHVDVRDYFDYDASYFAQQIDNTVIQIYNSQYISGNDVNNFILITNKLKENILQTTRYIANLKLSDSTKKKDDSITETIKKISNKLLNGYKHEDIKNTLIDESPLLKYVKSSIAKIDTVADQLINEVDKFGKLHEKYDNKLFKTQFTYHYGVDTATNAESIAKILLLNEELQVLVLYMYVNIMDLYFLRRFLDKDYINHAIAYTGYIHSFNYLYVLVKNFDFKITHITNPKVDTDQLENLIKKSEYDKAILEHYMPNELFQCINMTNFPDRFE
jgi:hypothetical protein